MIGGVRSRRLAAAVVLLALAGAGGWGAWNSLATCGMLDRLVGRSGCVASFRLADFRPLLFRSMAPAGDGSRMRIFGHAVRGRDIQAVQLVLDTDGAGEASREPLPFGRAPYDFVPSPDQRQAVLVCRPGTVLCDGQRPQGLVVALGEGRVERELPVADFGGWDFRSGEPAPALLFEQTLVGNGEVVAAPDPDTGGIVLARVADGAEIARMAPPEPVNGRGDPYAFYVRASPSGRYLAVIDRASKAGTRIDVWDAAERRFLRTLRTDAAHRIGPAAAWTGDERRIVGLLYRETAAKGRPDEVATAETEALVFAAR